MSPTQTHMDIARRWIDLTKRTGEDDPVVPVSQAEWDALSGYDKAYTDAEGTRWLVDMRLEVS